MCENASFEPSSGAAVLALTRSKKQVEREHEKKENKTKKKTRQREKKEKTDFTVTLETCRFAPSEPSFTKLET